MATGVLFCFLLACGEEKGQPTAPMEPLTDLITVAAILEAPTHFYGREVYLEGRITKKLTEDPTWEFIDGTGAIPVEFPMILGTPMTNVPFSLNGTAVRGYPQVHIVVAAWEYLAPA